MKQFNQDMVSERFTKLPEAVQDVIISDEMSEHIRETMEAVGLEGEQKKQCIQQITLVSVGFSTTNDFHEYIHNELNLPEEKVQTLEKMATEHIFTPIKKCLLSALQSSQKDGAGGAHTTTTGANDPYREP